jgi:hypothetical protein
VSFRALLIAAAIASAAAPPAWARESASSVSYIDPPLGIFRLQPIETLGGETLRAYGSDGRGRKWFAEFSIRAPGRVILRFAEAVGRPGGRWRVVVTRESEFPYDRYRSLRDASVEQLAGWSVFARQIVEGPDDPTMVSDVCSEVGGDTVQFFGVNGGGLVSFQRFSSCAHDDPAAKVASRLLQEAREYLRIAGR